MQLKEQENPIQLFSGLALGGAYNKLPWIGAQKLRIKEFQRSEKL